MKRPAWKSVNAEIAKKHRDEKINEEKLEKQRRAYERISLLGYANVQRTYPNIVKFRSVYKVDGIQMYHIPFKERYRLIRERMMESLASELIDYIDIDRHSHYGLFDEVWEGTIGVVKIEGEAKDENW